MPVGHSAVRVAGRWTAASRRGMSELEAVRRFHALLSARVPTPAKAGKAVYRTVDCREFLHPCRDDSLPRLQALPAISAGLAVSPSAVGCRKILRATNCS